MVASTSSIEAIGVDLNLSFGFVKGKNGQFMPSIDGFSSKAWKALLMAKVILEGKANRILQNLWTQF